MLKVQLKSIRLGAKIPEYKSVMAAGADIHACIDHPITIDPGQKSILIPTGISIFLGDPTYAFLIYPRSGRGHKEGLVLGNGTGVIDADYQGEIMVSACVRPGHSPVTIKPGESIAQIVFTRVDQFRFEEVTQFTDNTERGAGGFGSTGK